MEKARGKVLIRTINNFSNGNQMACDLNIYLYG